MRWTLLFTFLTLPTIAAADAREQFYGTWGTAKQCAKDPIKEGLTVRAQPFEITDEWLKQGQLWCRLDWFPVEPREDSVFTGAYAQCGEDAVRGYILGMRLSDEKLTLRWDVLLSNGPLARCVGQ